MINTCRFVLFATAMLLTPVSGAVAQLLDGGTLDQEDVAHNAPDYSPFVDC